MAHGDANLMGGYQGVFDDDEAPMIITDNTGVPYDALPATEIRSSRWNHVENLDTFFKQIYNYHQRHGFMCMLIENCLQLLQFLFVIVFVTFLFSCVDYAILFKDKPVGGHNTTEHVKVKLKDAITPPGQCIAGLSGTIQFFLIIFLLVWLVRVVLVYLQMKEYLKVQLFFTTALKIRPDELDTLTWNDVQQRLIEVQKEHKMSVQTKEINALDISHRILRHENYLVGLVNKDVLPFKYRVPFIGNMVFFTSGLKYNLNILLFSGPWAPFQNNWELKEEYKMIDRESYASEELSKSMIYIGLINIVLLPLILIWQLLYVIFSYADVVKREPGFLGARMWSEYARLQLRHFNELEHELNNRLCKAYDFSAQYMNSFTSHLTVVLCRNMVFFAGSFWVVLVGLTVWDEDFLAVDHIVTALAVLSMVLAVCRAAIPSENIISCPEFMMQNILGHIHYAPDHWRGAAHTIQVKEEFGNLFTYKFTNLLCEILSPVVTPFIILGPLRSRSRDLVKFFRDNTQKLEISGDVCSFAEMDIKRNGDPRWNVGPNFNDTNVPNPFEQHSVPYSQQAEMGKVELSLIHFAHSNPLWLPADPQCQRFIRNVNSQVDERMPSIVGPTGQVLQHSMYTYSILNSFRQGGDYPLKGVGVSSAQGPLSSSSMSDESSFVQSCLPERSLSQPSASDSASLHMSASAIYLHEKHHGSLNTARHQTTFQSENPRRFLHSIQENRTEATPLLRSLK